MANKEVKTLTAEGVTYDIKDAKARSNISSLSSRVSTAEGSITGLQSNVSGLQTNVDDLQTSVGNIEDNYVTTNTTQKISGDKTFSGDAVVPTVAVTDKSGKAVNAKFISNKFKLVSELPASPVAGVIYFVEE